MIVDNYLITYKQKKSGDSYDFSRPKKLVNLFLSRVTLQTKDSDLPVIEILSVKDNKTVLLLAPTEKERDEWIASLNFTCQRLIEENEHEVEAKTQAQSDYETQM